MAIGSYRGILTDGGFSLSLSGIPSMSEDATEGVWITEISGSASFRAGAARFEASNAVEGPDQTFILIEDNWEALVTGNTFKVLE